MKSEERHETLGHVETQEKVITLTEIKIGILKFYSVYEVRKMSNTKNGYTLEDRKRAYLLFAKMIICAQTYEREQYGKGQQQACHG